MSHLRRQSAEALEVYSLAVATSTNSPASDVVCSWPLTNVVESFVNPVNGRCESLSKPTFISLSLSLGSSFTPSCTSAHPHFKGEVCGRSN